MEKYVNKIKSALNSAVLAMLLKKESIKLADGSTVTLNRTESVLITNFSEIKLMDFVGGRKFQVAGEGEFSVQENLKAGNVLKYVSFRFANGSVNFNDATQEFDVISIGEFSISSALNKS
jgi:hypothetical protein